MIGASRDACSSDHTRTWQTATSGDLMAASRGRRHNTLTALKAALHALQHHRGLAVTFLVATLVQGTLQGAMVWALRQVLIALSRPGGVGRGVLLVGALAVFAVWLLRSAAVFAAQLFSARLAYRVELDWLS